jgi:hypothetical protein
MTNTILANYSVGISLTVGNILTVDSILWHQIPITISASPTTSVMMASQVSGDPAFASDGYHLTATSAAIGHGIPAGVPADIDGQVRRAIPDLGADEYWDMPPTPRVYFPMIMKGK